MTDMPTRPMTHNGPMTDIDLDSLRAVAEAATPGEWEFRPRRGFQMVSDAPATIGFTYEIGAALTPPAGADETEGGR